MLEGVGRGRHARGVLERGRILRDYSFR